MPVADERHALIDRHADASRRFNEAVNAFAGPRARLRRLSRSAGELAALYREAAEAGLVREPPEKTAINPPRELSPSSSRVPAVAEWRRLDRTYEALTALLADPASTLAAAADATDALAAAATEVAGAFGDDATTVSELAICTFCLKAGTQVRRIVAGPEALICDECIGLCVEVLEDELGDDWRAGLGG